MVGNRDHRVSIVIFGASGDLTRRKLVPSLFNLHCAGALPDPCPIYGAARSRFSDGEFREHLRGDAVGTTDARSDEWEQFSSWVHYIPVDITKRGDIEDLDRRIAASCGRQPADNRIYYLAVMPELYADAVAALGQAGLLNEDGGWRRVVIEKPFGTDIESARALNQRLHESLEERQIFRIDHYLGKETVQNLLVFRFANAIFEPVWNRVYVDHVQISVLESIGIDGRGAYYDGAGVLRDMFQSHLLQLLTLVAMEPPAAFEPDPLRNEKVKVLNTVRRSFSTRSLMEHSTRGQYEGYLSEKGVAPDSTTATYGALRLYVDNWRWQGVPFFLRSGKAVTRKATEIVIQFHSPPHTIFDLPARGGLKPNSLHIAIQPDEGVHLTVEQKVPGTRMQTRSEALQFHFPEGAIPDAYERLLLDAIEGDASLFTRGDEIELAWSIIDPVVRAWEQPGAPPLLRYQRGSWGPPEAAQLLGAGRTWMVARQPHD